MKKLFRSDIRHRYDSDLGGGGRNFVWKRRSPLTERRSFLHAITDLISIQNNVCTQRSSERLKLQGKKTIKPSRFQGVEGGEGDPDIAAAEVCEGEKQPSRITRFLASILP